MNKPFDSIGCTCGARTAFGNLAKPNEDPILFVGGSYKNGHVKISQEPVNEAKNRCLWCGNEWPENLKKVLERAKP